MAGKLKEPRQKKAADAHHRQQQESLKGDQWPQLQPEEVHLPAGFENGDRRAPDGAGKRDGKQDEPRRRQVLADDEVRQPDAEQAD